MPPSSDDAAANPHLFSGVRFALVGFDQISRPQYLLDMLRGGATDAGDWEGDCTHVVVYGLLHDDPRCVAARDHGKRVVTEEWVDDSIDLGVLADADRVLYAPVRDAAGIPGAHSLLISLTGYEKNMRQDIMKMVSLMGAQFSKALAADKVTHLVCYRFEGSHVLLGEKYNVAKLVNIKLVNHRWLEDCLRAWEILPIDNYRKSGWEIEIMETQVNDSEDETEDAGRGSSGVTRSTRVSEIKTRAHFDSDVNAPNCVPISASSNAQGAAEKLSGIAPTANGATVSVDSGASPCGDDECPANQVARDDHSTSPETRATALLCSPSVHKSIATPIQENNIENINANCLQNSCLVAANNLIWPTNPSEENLSRAVLHSSELSIKVDKKDDGHTPDLSSTVHQPHTEEKQKLCESSLRSEGNSTSQNNHILSYSRRRSSKSVSPDANLRSAQQTALPQSSKGNTSGIEFYNPPRKHDQDFSDPADARSLQEAEVVKHVDRSGSALFQRRKSILSSVSSKLPNEDPGSGTEVLSCLISSKESASEGATVSNLNRNSAGCTNVDGHLNSVPTEKQISGSFKSNLLSSLKLASSGKAKRLPENSSNDENMEASVGVKAPALHESTPEKGCAIFPYVNSEVRKESSGVSLQNRKTDMSDAEQVYKVDVAALGLESDRAAPHQSLEASPGDIPVNAVIGKNSKTRAKASTSRVRNAGAKRSRDAKSKTAAAFAKHKPEVAASKPMHDRAVPCENAEIQQEEKCSSPNAAEPESLFPEEILNGKPRNEASKSELLSVIPQKNMKEDHRNPSSSASADDNLEKSSLKVPDSAARNSVAEGPRTADGKAAEKSEIMSLKSNFSVVVPPENREAYPKKLSSSASADDPETYAANKVPNSRERKVVAKRKMSAVQKQKFTSEPCKAAGVFVTEDKIASSERAARNSRNAGKVAVDQDAQNTIENKTKDPVGSFCKDTMEERSKNTQTSKLRSKKRQKTVDLVDGSMDYDKENIPVSCSFTSKTKYGNNSISSKSTTKVLPNGKVELDKNRMIKGDDCGTLNVVEPTRFILSGHRLLRKEYKSILTCLKGRVCRDSHHWSFQATHLVATELRRTEKFFAAAAVGRWILKPDYLTACNEAGKFLEEEPFEWHGHGLNSSETISLDAPRKWRQQKQCTGHGAFYGMQIVIYGECIAPTLDTLKRVIRAADGTILATSPPYTRAFKSNVNFAVVSAGMPSIDTWVQEFMRHNIPCISADYLVEYVCKPGYSLSKHVLFNMHDLADKALEKLLKNQHVGEAAEPDIACSTCGSNDQDRPMLVCGSDGNPAGCGVQVHVDCCEPPIEGAGDWLCPKCEEPKPAAKKAKKPAKSRVLKSR